MFYCKIIDDTFIGGEPAAKGKVYEVDEATLKQHEAMGFHAGWGQCADQLEALAKTI